jgi:choline dehydrogenase
MRRPGQVPLCKAMMLSSMRSRGWQSGYHACGTCKMGQDAMSVLDERLRVRGVSGLRVADLILEDLATA